MTSEYSVWAAVADAFDPPEGIVPGPSLQPKQERATELGDVADELLYGGSAGGGKSVWLRHYAIREALRQPGSYIGILRRDLQRLKKTHARPLTELLNGLATLNRTDWTWTFANGSVIQFIGLQHDGDELNYNSTEFDLLLWDELTEFTESQYTYMLSRLRSQKGHRPHSVAATNPIGTGYTWVKRRWVKPRDADLLPGQAMPLPFEVWAPPLPDGSGEAGPTRTFVPATVFDNPALLASNPQYVQRLRSEPDPRKRKALLEGDWDAMDQIPGALWTHTVIADHRVRECPDAIRSVVSVDPAVTAGPDSDLTGVLLISKAIIGEGREAEPHYYVREDRSGRHTMDAWAELAIRLANEHSAEILVEVDQGGDLHAKSVRDTARHLRLPCPIVKTVRAGSEGSKAQRAQRPRALYAQGQVHHVGTFEALEEQMTTWVPDLSRKSPDRVDALVHGINHLDRNGQQAVPVRDLSRPIPTRALS